MTICKLKSALFAGLAVLASAAVAAEHDLPNPPLSEFVDAESSINVPLPTDEGRRIRLTLAFASTPSNAVQVAFGNDLNCSETLEPEETELLLGVDCGEPFARVESPGIASPLLNQLSDTNQTVTVFELKQPRERWSLAKVTTHNLADTNVIVAVEFYNRGQVLFLR